MAPGGPTVAGTVCCMGYLAGSEYVYINKLATVAQDCLLAMISSWECQYTETRTCLALCSKSTY